MQVDGRVQRDPEFPIAGQQHRIAVDGRDLDAPDHVYLMLHKPRGLVTSVSDERGRDTVYRCLEGAGLPWIAPVGRLDKASEGLLLFTNNPAWAAGITDPERGPEKTYHVQVDCIPDAALLLRLQDGVTSEGELLRAGRVRLLRAGSRNAWLEIVLDEGRNRHIRRLLAACGVGALRLLRVGIGGLQLGTLAKGQWRKLTAAEINSLAESPNPEARL